jgi:hypothetical protein
MELLVQATKGGWRILYKTENFPFSFASDLRRQDANNNRITVGHVAYSIALAGTGCVFSKYICIWDADRRAIGNLSFSVYISGKLKISGQKIKNLLDELLTEYEHKYIVDGNLLNRQEDWTFFDGILKSYKNSLIPSNFEPDMDWGKSSNDAAFVYFDDDRHLKEYLETPYQKKFSSFKQIFFVELSLENKLENPLNVLQHNHQANLTGFKPISKPAYNSTLKPINIDAYTRKLPLIPKNVVTEEFKPTIKTENNLFKQLFKKFVAFKSYFWPDNLP